MQKEFVNHNIIGIREYETVNENHWGNYGNALIVGENTFSFFKPSTLAIKEILQNGAVAGGDNAECLVKIYQKEDGSYHLLIANTADEPADLRQMMDFNHSRHDSVSNCNGAGLKAGLSFMYGIKKGSFKVATRYEDGCIGYRESPYAGIMPIKEDTEWPVDEKYRTYVDTEILDYPGLEQALSMESLKEDLGVLFGLRIERGMQLRLEVLDKTQEQVAPLLPKEMPKAEPKWERKKDHSMDPDLIIHHQQKAALQVSRMDEDKQEYVSTVHIQATDRISAQNTGPWGRKLANQGAWLIMDGVIQAYLGTDLFLLAKHPSMNGRFTFIELESIENGEFNGLRPMFNSSKTSVNRENEIMQELYRYFQTPEQEQYQNTDHMNSISEGYRWLREEDAEKKVREHQDLIYRLYSITETENGTPTRYQMEYRNNKGSIYDGVIIRDTERGSVVDTIIEYKKSPITKDDIGQIVRYLMEESDKENVVNHLVLSGPTIRTDALEYLQKVMAMTNDTYLAKSLKNMSLYLYNDKFDRAEEDPYPKRKLKNLVDEPTFQMLKDSNEYWQSTSFTEQVTETEIQFNQEFAIYGSAPVAYLYQTQIAELNQRYRMNSVEADYKHMPIKEVEKLYQKTLQEFYTLPLAEQMSARGEELSKKINQMIIYLNPQNRTEAAEQER